MGQTRILLVLTRTLGDVMLTHNLIDGCIRKFGDCHITVVVEKAYENILEGNPKINRIITGTNWHMHWSDIIDMVVSKQYDEVMIPQQLHAEDNVWHQLEEYRHQHLVDFYLKRCRLPERLPEDKLQIFIRQEDIDFVRYYPYYPCQDVMLSNPEQPVKRIIFHTKSLADGKDWDKFNHLSKASKDKGYSVIQMGAKTDPLIDGCLDYREAFSFRQIAAVCSKAFCFVGLDSGLSYIAAASGCKSIIIQGSTIPQTSGPWGSNVINVVSKTRPECEEVRCHGNCRFKDKCISNITVEDVLKHIA
jgi:heptosyltransferase-3